jgi:hypothetical protein
MPAPSDLSGLDLDTVIAYLEASVRDRGPDYVYEPPEEFDGGCVYAENRETEFETPSCIIGVVYFLHTGQLVPASYEGTTCSVLFEAKGVQDEDAVALASRVQSLQDERVPWGLAVLQALSDVAVWVESGRPRTRAGNFPAWPHY